MADFEPLVFDAGGNEQSSSSIGEHADFLSLGGNSGGESGGDDSGSGGGTERFDPTIHVSPDKRNADGSYRKKRGRKPNSTNGGNKRKADNSTSIESLTRVLSVLHLGIAAATKSPEMALEDMEAEALAKATANVLEEFDIKPDPKIEAIVGLLMVSTSIYGPRIYNIRERRKEERLEQRHG